MTTEEKLQNFYTASIESAQKMRRLCWMSIKLPWIRSFRSIRR